MIGKRASEQLDFFGLTDGDGTLRDEALPVLRGIWERPEGYLFARHLKCGELMAALEVLGSLSNNAARTVLVQCGFEPQATGGRRGMLESVQGDLVRAAQLKVTGIELREIDAEQGRQGVKDAAAPAMVFPDAMIAPSFTRALGVIQMVMAAPSVEVGVAGAAELSSRGSLLFVGGQAIERGVSGFGIEGVDGKFRLPDSVELAGLRVLYGAAGAAIAEAEVKGLLPRWAAEKGMPRMSDLVSENVAKILRGAVSVDGAEAIWAALQDGSVREYGAQLGEKLAGQVLAKQGVRLDAAPLEQVIESEGLTLITATRGQYVGPVVLNDHRASVVKASRDSAIIVPHKCLPEGVEPPKRGDSMLVKFVSGQMRVAVSPGVSRGGEVGR